MALAFGHLLKYHIALAQNFNDRKVWWQIWRFTTNPPKTFILAILQCKVVNPPMFCPPKCLLAAIHQSFLPPKDFVPYGTLYSLFSYKISETIVLIYKSTTNQKIFTVKESLHRSVLCETLMYKILLSNEIILYYKLELV